MLNNERQAGAAEDSSTEAELLPSASLAQNPMLGDVYEDILNLFTSKDKHRKDWMKYPFVDCGKAIATNGWSLVSVNKELVKPYEEIPGKTKAVYPVEHNCNKEILLQDLIEAMEKVPLIDGYDEIQERTECSECNGTSIVEWEYHGNKRHTMDYDCPVCEGEGYRMTGAIKPNGKKDYDPVKLIGIGNSKFNILRLFDLRKTVEILNQQKFSLVRQTTQNSVSLFIVADVEVLLMPCLPDSDMDVVANIA